MALDTLIGLRVEVRLSGSGGPFHDPSSLLMPPRARGPDRWHQRPVRTDILACKASTPYQVGPMGHFFMMGDNRDNSTDSRDQSASGVGFVPYENLVGRAEIIFFSIEEGTPPWQIWKWPEDARWGRFFQKIR